MSQVLLKRIHSLNEANKYQEAGSIFLQATNTTLEVIESVPQRSPLWVGGDGKYGIHYVCTLKNARSSYTFDHWGSIRDKEMVELAERVENDMCSFVGEYKNKLAIFLKKRGVDVSKPFSFKAVRVTKEAVKPAPYDILACLDLLYEDNFKDFCSSYGYSEDSIKGEKTYRGLLEQDRALRLLFNSNELEALAMIQ